MEKKRTFNANTRRDFANGEPSEHAPSEVTHADTFKRLEAFARAFRDLDLNAHRIARSKLRYVRAELFAIEFVDDVRHDRSLRSRTEPGDGDDGRPALAMRSSGRGGRRAH